MEDKILIKLLLDKNEYETLITFINKKYLVDALSLINEIKNRGDIKIE